MIQTGQIIYFSDQKLMCFGVESIEDITVYPKPYEPDCIKLPETWEEIF